MNNPVDESGEGSGFGVSRYNARLNGVDVYEVANQLGGFIGPNTETFLKEFLSRNEKLANDLAEEVIRLRALSTDVEPVGYLVPRGDVAGPDNEYYSFCEDQGSAAAEADIYDKGYFPIYAAPPPPSVAVKALEDAFKHFKVVYDPPNGVSINEATARKAIAVATSALAEQVQDVAGLSAWQGWDQSRMPWSEAKHKDAVCYAAFGEAWSMNDAAALIGFIGRTWTAARAAKQDGKP